MITFVHATIASQHTTHGLKCVCGCGPPHEASQLPASTDILPEQMMGGSGHWATLISSLLNIDLTLNRGDNGQKCIKW